MAIYHGLFSTIIITGKIWITQTKQIINMTPIPDNKVEMISVWLEGKIYFAKIKKGMVIEPKLKMSWWNLWSVCLKGNEIECSFFDWIWTAMAIVNPLKNNSNIHPNNKMIMIFPFMKDSSEKEIETIFITLCIIRKNIK